MSDRRSRERKGRHASIAGDAADRVIETLVNQFDDPHAFVRELIQNSLDAGAARIDVDMRYEKGALVIEARDDGEGMDRETIEGYLLVKFRSTKEQDLTKIGKFGIGFVSLFALRPDRAWVDTGRDGVWHRVEFAADLSYTLLRMEDPFEGTTVGLSVPCTAAEARKTALAVRDRAERWCRFVPHDIRTSAANIPGGWGTTPIRQPFTLEAPVTVRDEQDGFHAVLAIATSPLAGFYNRGLTLLEETPATYLPGVSFRVDDGRLEHTLTRDNVIRDAHFERAIGRLRALATGALADAVHLEAEQAARSGDAARIARLWSAIAPDVAWTWRADAPLLPAVGRDPLPLRALEGLLGGWLTQPVVYVGRAEDPLARAVAAAGTPVIAGGPDDPHVAFLARRGLAIVAVADAFQIAFPAPDAPGAAAIAEAALVLGLPLSAARFAGASIEGGLVYAATDPFTLARAGAGGKGAAAVSVDHPLVRELAALPPRLAAPVLARGLSVVLAGVAGPERDALLDLAADRAREIAP